MSISLAPARHRHKPTSFMRTRLCLCYVAAYLFITGLAFLVAPTASLALMRSTIDYGEVMPRWVAMMSLALGTLIAQTVHHRLTVLYPLGFFMPAAMLAGFVGLYRLSGDPLFLTVLAVVGVGVVLTGASLLFDRAAGRSRTDRAQSSAWVLGRVHASARPPTAERGARSALLESDMPGRYTHEQIAARDDQGERHIIMVRRAPIPGSPHLHGSPHYTWNDGQVLHLVDAKAGIIECALTGKRLKIEDWRG